MRGILLTVTLSFALCTHKPHTPHVHEHTHAHTHARTPYTCACTHPSFHLPATAEEKQYKLQNQAYLTKNPIPTIVSMCKLQQVSQPNRTLLPHCKMGQPSLCGCTQASTWHTVDVHQRLAFFFSYWRVTVISHLLHGALSISSAPADLCLWHAGTFIVSYPQCRMQLRIIWDSVQVLCYQAGS